MMRIFNEKRAPNDNRMSGSSISSSEKWFRETMPGIPSKASITIEREKQVKAGLPRSLRLHMHELITFCQIQMVKNESIPTRQTQMCVQSYIACEPLFMLHLSLLNTGLFKIVLSAFLRLKFSGLVTFLQCLFVWLVVDPERTETNEQKDGSSVFLSFPSSLSLHPTKPFGLSFSFRRGRSIN